MQALLARTPQWRGAEQSLRNQHPEIPLSQVWRCFVGLNRAGFADPPHYITATEVTYICC